MIERNFYRLAAPYIRRHHAIVRNKNMSLTDINDRANAQEVQHG
ncbi:hypothetical protein DFO67_107125 [Modicisalibacter xianhensis]|uniref:Uncharacterized protein n=1 Tax=Modicisalibacter xianhensis TaxID=442341 RepID=A0A4R8FS83_9GAMM|nr:hypothetical protein [Halomonas xianhensis]TDX29449.1 hypothetical protein DFO67_107125 [Halomonas xianhensis]